MKGIAWGPLYDTYHGRVFDVNALDSRISDLYIDDDVQNGKGVYL